MNTIIKKFGDVVSKEVYVNPLRARRLLTTAYSLTGWKDARFGGSGLAGAYARMNAVVSHYICHAFQHSHNAAMVNVFFPCEILHAMDITPMFPEALSVYIANSACEQVFADAAENADVPESFCSYHKIMIGLAETGVLPKPCSLRIPHWPATQISFLSGVLLRTFRFRMSWWMCRTISMMMR